MSKTFIILLVLPALACIALPAVHSNENKETNESLVANNTKSVISQEVSTEYIQIVELTPIPTDIPKPTPSPIITRKPQPITITPGVRPTRTPPVITVTSIPPKFNGYDFNYANRTAIDYAQIDKEYVKKRICEVFGSECSNALIIAFKESGYRTNASSSGYFSTANLGVFQINCRWQKNRVGGDCLKLFDLETNLRVAKQIYNEQGWKPWSTKVFLNS